MVPSGDQQLQHPNQHVQSGSTATGQPSQNRPAARDHRDSLNDDDSSGSLSTDDQPDPDDDDDVEDDDDDNDSLNRLAHQIVQSNPNNNSRLPTGPALPPPPINYTPERAQRYFRKKSYSKIVAVFLFCFLIHMNKLNYMVSIMLTHSNHKIQ